jgi:hypothetical protein
MEQYPALEPSAAMRKIEGEAAVVTPRDSTLHTFNGVGTRILELADGTRSLGSIVTTIVDEFEVEPDTAERDARAFVTELVQKGVLILRDRPTDRTRELP